MPYRTIWHTFIRHCPPLVVHEDSQAVIGVVQTGRNPTMRCFVCRNHRIRAPSRAQCINWYTRNRIICMLTSIQKVFRLREVASGLWPDQKHRPQEARALGCPGASDGLRGGVSATHFDVSCARIRVDTDTTKVTCASNRVSVSDDKGLKLFTIFHTICYNVEKGMHHGCGVRQRMPDATR